SCVAAVILIGTATLTMRGVAADQSSIFPGVLQPTQALDLNFTRAGTVAKVYVTPGEMVHAGQLLATLQPGPLGQQLQADHVVLASDEQRLGQLLGPAGVAAAQQAQQIYAKAEQQAGLNAARG